MKLHLQIFASALLTVWSAPLVHAQNAPNIPTIAPPNAASRLFVVEENEVATLSNVAARARNGAISLRASQQALDNNAAAREALLGYVRGGGTVFLHNDAARLFGYRTVEARQSSNRVAGQLLGRARAALPFGAHPLLWDEAADPRAPLLDPTLLPGVHTVFYVLRPGDHLVEGHAAATALLQVSDLAANQSRPLYASAIAPFGRGWAIFTPDFIDQTRGDGALFLRNLLDLLPNSKRGAKWIGISASLIQNGGLAPDALRQALAANAQSSSPALPALGTAAPAAPRPPAATSVSNDTDARVILSRAEAGAYATLLGAGGDGAGAVINLLRARLFLARGEGEAAARAVEAAAALAPQSAEVALWRGVLLAAASEQLNQPAPTRARFLSDASRALNAATTGASLSPSSAPGSLALPAATLRAWSLKTARIAQIFSLEPPLVQQFGSGDAAITVRAASNDNSLRFLLSSVAALANARNLGWRGDREEILLFPNSTSFALYRRALGLGGSPIRFPSGGLGEVVGQRVLLLSTSAQPRVQPDFGGGQNVIVPSQSQGTAVLARLHSFVLLDALDPRARRVPNWMRLGLENLVASIVTDDSQVGASAQFLQPNNLLSPAQFAQNRLGPAAVAQATSLMAYFYSQYGAGAVVETLQRLGAGQNIDAALEETTGNDELSLFRSWGNARFGTG